MNDAPPDMDELLDRARALLTQHEVDSWLATRSEVRMASTIRDLMAALEYARESWHQANAVAELAMKHRDVAEAEVERVSALLRWETAGRIHDRASADAAEARLRELASAERVAKVDDLERGGRVRALALGLPLDAELIRRPEMMK